MSFLSWGDIFTLLLRGDRIMELKHTRPFTLQYLTGHDNIKTTMRYVHPREVAGENLLVWLGNLQRR